MRMLVILLGLIVVGQAFAHCPIEATGESAGAVSPPPHGER